jgi:hypothetical protein
VRESPRWINASVMYNERCVLNESPVAAAREPAPFYFSRSRNIFFPVSYFPVTRCSRLKITTTGRSVRDSLINDIITSSRRGLLSRRAIERDVKKPRCNSEYAVFGTNVQNGVVEMQVYSVS